MRRSLFCKTTAVRLGELPVSRRCDYVLWYAKQVEHVKYRQLYRPRKAVDEWRHPEYRSVRMTDWTSRSPTSRCSKRSRIYRERLTSQSRRAHLADVHEVDGVLSDLARRAGTGQAMGTRLGMATSRQSARASRSSERQTASATFDYLDDFPVHPISNVWTDTWTAALRDDKIYVVQTSTKVVERCILMTTDPGDLVLDPTCGSGTTAYVAEQWGRRWITIDTSPRRAGAGPHAADGRALSLLPARRQPRGPREGGRAHRQAAARRARPTAISARASSTSARRTSRSRPSPTTPRST